MRRWSPKLEAHLKTLLGIKTDFMLSEDMVVNLFFPQSIYKEYLNHHWGLTFSTQGLVFFNHLTQCHHIHLTHILAITDLFPSQVQGRGWNMLVDRIEIINDKLECFQFPCSKLLLTGRSQKSESQRSPRTWAVSISPHCKKIQVSRPPMSSSD